MVQMDEGVMVWDCFRHSGVGTSVWIDQFQKTAGKRTGDKEKTGKGKDKTPKETEIENYYLTLKYSHVHDGCGDKMAALNCPRRSKMDKANIDCLLLGYLRDGVKIQEEDDDDSIEEALKMYEKLRTRPELTDKKKSKTGVTLSKNAQKTGGESSLNGSLDRTNGSLDQSNGLLDRMDESLYDEMDS
uniref:Uncharacterized protein n=1 Tax=Romanomermis culicivorax TaxID=13658 RepID=A0A915IMZ0_ROMCU